MEEISFDKSNGWLLRTFGEFIHPSGVRNRENRDYPVYSINNKNGFVPQSEQYEMVSTHLTGADKSVYKIVEPKSFAYNPARVNVGSLGYQNTDSPVIVSSLYEVFSTDETCDDMFLYQWFKTPAFFDEIRRLSEGSVRVYFYLDKLMQTRIWMPVDIEHQRRIANLLVSLDSKIESEKTKTEKQKDLKASMLSKMFPKEGQKVPEIRFEGFTEDWEQRKVQDLVDDEILAAPMDGNHGEKHPTTSDYVASGIPFIMARDLGCGKVDLEHCNFISKERAERLDKGFAQDGDVLLTHKATIGETAILNGLKEKYAVLTPQVTYYRIMNYEKLSRDFLYAYFNTIGFQTKLKTKAIQSTRAYIGITDQRKLSVRFPMNIEEQKKIGDYFFKLENLITLHQRKYEKLLDCKKAFLEKMIGGES